MIRAVLPALLACAVLMAPPAFARPAMKAADPAADQARREAAEASFARADANGDGAVSKEEFMAAFPSMKEAAFAAIDGDGNGGISREEWEAFSVGHSSGRGMGGMAMPPAGDGAAGKGSLPLVMPPAAK